ncbi:hypothetical protein ACFQZO_24405 [Bradyrhizobium sp. GCM10027634]|uniref:hypothetical protein n=1 Tax=unclassified Bradyrhizobium TaxID=2631580 RepID=UPI00263B9A92|nr:hypothetical protein [Bradyrhizobium sp. WYCCWR 12677]MDN5003984.1 hypothetical protein [Bradyrhizobium sp. WYCCWR 12677]
MVPQFVDDVADWPTVPTAVRDKLLSIRDLAKDKNLLANRADGDLQDERLRQQTWEAKLQDLRKNPHQADGAIAQAEAEIKSAAAKVARLTERRDALSQAWRQAALLRRNLEKYMQDVAMNGVILHDGTPPKLKSGENALDALERAARRTRTLKADRRDVQSAPFPAATAKQLARDQIKRWAESARPDVTELVYRCGTIDFPKTRVQLDQYLPTTPGSIQVVDPVALMALTNPKALEALIDAEIDATNDDKIALSAEQRVAKLTEIAGDILAAEREECFFAELAGLLPRPDSDVRAVLCLHSSMPAPKE